MGKSNEKNTAETMKIQSQTIYRWILRVLFCLSLVIFSLHQMFMDYTAPFIIITAAFALTGAVIAIMFKEEEVLDFIKRNQGISFLVAIGAVLIAFQGYETRGLVFAQVFQLDLPFNIFALRFWLFSAIAIFFIGIWVIKNAILFFKELFSDLSENEKRFYFAVSLLMTAVIFITYLKNEHWYTQYDVVYSMDSSFVLDTMIKNPDYYDIRHVCPTPFLFPVWAIVNRLLIIFAPENLVPALTAIFFQALNVQAMLVTGVMLKKITKSNVVFLLYICSFHFIQYGMSFEKYPLCVFFSVLYVYIMLNKPNKSAIPYVVMSSFISTSAVLGVLELFTSEKPIEKIKKIGKIICTAVIMLVTLGRARMLVLTEVFGYAGDMKNQFISVVSFTFVEKLSSYTKMIKNCFFALSSCVLDGRYIWTDMMNGFSALSIIIILIILVGVIVKIKDKFFRICAAWLVFSFIFVVILGWLPYESPLFGLYFSWAVIPLFKFGADALMKLFNMKPKPIYTVLLCSMLFINIAAMFDIAAFINTLS